MSHNMHYHTPDFWQTVQTEYLYNPSLFLCNGSSTFRRLWKYEEPFCLFVYHHAKDFAKTYPNAIVCDPSCDTLFSVCENAERDIALKMSFLVYMTSLTPKQLLKYANTH